MNITCSHCKAALKAMPEYFGKTVQCPDCGEEILLPALPDDSPTHPSKNNTKTKKLQKSQPINDQPTICFFCKQAIPVNARKCYHCGSVLKKSGTYYFLVIISIIAFVVGLYNWSQGNTILSLAKGAIHEIYGALYLVIAAICFATTFILWGLLSNNE